MRICVHNCGKPAEECKCLQSNSEGVQKLDLVPHFFPAEVDVQAQLARATPEQLEGMIDLIAEQAVANTPPFTEQQLATIVAELSRPHVFSLPLVQDPLRCELTERIGRRWVEKMVLLGRIRKDEEVEMDKEALRKTVAEVTTQKEVGEIIDSLTDLLPPGTELPTGFGQIQEQLGIDPSLQPGDLSVTFAMQPNIREALSDNLRDLAKDMLEDSKFSSALAHYNPQKHPVGLVLLKEDGSQMSPEEMEAWIAELRKLPPASMPGGNISTADLARYQVIKGHECLVVGDPIDFAELERGMSEEQLRLWQLPTPALIRELESQGTDCDLLRMYPHEVKPLDLTRISSQCRNNDIAELYPKTFTIKNVGGDYQRLRPRYVYKGRTKRGARRYRLQIVSRKESV